MCVTVSVLSIGLYYRGTYFYSGTRGGEKVQQYKHRSSYRHAVSLKSDNPGDRSNEREGNIPILSLCLLSLSISGTQRVAGGRMREAEHLR